MPFYEVVAAVIELSVSASRYFKLTTISMRARTLCIVKSNLIPARPTCCFYSYQFQLQLQYCGTFIKACAYVSLSDLSDFGLPVLLKLV